MRNSIKAAIKNIDTYGDTDIFPYSFEKYIFQDRPDLIQTALEELHSDFENQLTQNPPENINTLSPVGYTGYRWASQIDPLWNAYYLSLVIEMGPDIEQARIPVQDNTVFSYRFSPSTENGSIFDTDVNWKTFLETSRELAAQKNDAGDTKYPFVLVCDISDFYSRIYHHRIENALLSLQAKQDIVRRIVKTLQKFSGTVSYGLPVGGPASRLLAEISLNTADQLMRAHGIRFCRFVDDYRIFCASKEEAYRHLIFLSEKLFNEGLSLQKAKTRVLTAKEFLDETELLKTFAEVDEESLSDEDKLMRISLHFDPYSETRVEDYEHLKQQVSQVDVAGIISRELEKTRINPNITKQAIAAIHALDANSQKKVIKSLLEIENLHTLAPVFPRFMTVLQGIYKQLDAETGDLIQSKLIEFIQSESHVIQVSLNLSYAIRVLRLGKSTQDIERLFVSLFNSKSSLVRREILIAWVNWRKNHLLTDIKNNFGTLSKWERRAFVVGSFVLADEGRHWRNHNRRSFDPLEAVVSEWYSWRINNNEIVGL